MGITQLGIFTNIILIASTALMALFFGGYLWRKSTQHASEHQRLVAIFLLLFAVATGFKSLVLGFADSQQIAYWLNSFSVTLLVTSASFFSMSLIRYWANVSTFFTLLTASVVGLFAGGLFHFWQATEMVSNSWGVYFPYESASATWAFGFIIAILATIGIASFFKTEDHDANSKMHNVQRGLLLLMTSLMIFEYMQILHGVELVYMHMIQFASVSWAFFMFLYRPLEDYAQETQFKMRFRLLIKSVVYSFFTTFMPILIAGGLLTYSFDTLQNTSFFADTTDMTALKQSIIILSISIGLVSFVYSILVIRVLENRIKSLLQAMYEVLHNNFEHRVRVQKPSDEINSLGLAFNDMAGDLSYYADEIEKYSELLEQKVKQRTYELEEASEQSQKLLAQIKESSEQLQRRTGAITDQMKDGLLVIDAQSRILRVNKAFYKFFGIPANGLIDRRVDAIQELAEYQEFSFALQKMRDENLEQFATKIQLKPPLRGLLEVTISRFDLNESEKGYIFVLRDVAPPWGIVYEAESMQPIEGVVVRLYNEANNKIIAEETTDEFGRFLFYVDPGTYYVRLFKDGFHFPSEKEVGYHGEVIEITNRKEGIVHFDILMDRV